MTIRQASEILGIKVRTLRLYIRDGRLRAVKGSDNAWHIPEEIVYSREVAEYVNKTKQYSERFKGRAAMGVREQDGQDSEESV